MGQTRRARLALGSVPSSGVPAARHSVGARPGNQTVEDACSHAWLQLLTHPSVDLASPDWRLLGWLTQTATREAWRLQRRRVRDGLLDPITIESERRLRGPTRPGVDELAAQHARLDLVGADPGAPAPLPAAAGARLQLPRDRRARGREPDDDQQADRARQAPAARARRTPGARAVCGCGAPQRQRGSSPRSPGAATPDRPRLARAHAASR